VIEVQDDGRGLDYNKIKKIALATGMIHEEVADKLSNEHLSLLIFEPGFSTAENVSFIAGRGAGMDIVRATLYSVGGSISLKSEPGQGTSFIMTFPSSHPVSDFVMKHPEQIEKM
jgi:two-component system chemotaxis sensor kinase CheA